MDKRKRGIALFITLMVIASIMSIVAVSFSYLEKVRKDAGITAAILQGNLLHNNTVNVLKAKGFSSKNVKPEILKLIYTMPLMLSDSTSGFGLNLACHPLVVGVPISWLDKYTTAKEPDKMNLARDVLFLVMEQYDIQEPSELENLIMQAVTGKISQNEEFSSRVKSQKGVVSKEQFYRIISDYRLRFDDPQALLVPWEKYFSFVMVTNKTQIDGAYLTPEFISVAFEVPLEIVKESWIIGETTLSSFLQENAIGQTIPKKIYSNKALNAMHCELGYAYRERQYKLYFDYIEGRSGNFGFNGKAE